MSIEVKIRFLTKKQEVLINNLTTLQKFHTGSRFQSRIIRELKEELETLSKDHLELIALLDDASNRIQEYSGKIYVAKAEVSKEDAGTTTIEQKFWVDRNPHLASFIANNLNNRHPEIWEDFEDWLECIIASKKQLQSRYPTWQVKLIFLNRLLWFFVYTEWIALIRHVKRVTSPKINS